MTERKQRLSNDTAPLTPRIVTDALVLDFDFPALRIGVAEYPEGPTGCTVFFFPDGVTGAVDIRGGAPGGLLPHPWGRYDAICFAGRLTLRPRSGIGCCRRTARPARVHRLVHHHRQRRLRDHLRLHAEELRLSRQGVGARRAPGGPEWAVSPGRLRRRSIRHGGQGGAFCLP